MTKRGILQYLNLAFAALILFSMPTLCAICFVAALLPGESPQGFISGLMLYGLSTDPLILALRLFLFISSIYFWLKKQSWLTGAYLVIAGAGSGPLAFLFFSYFHISLIGCFALLLSFYSASLCMGICRSLKRNRKAWSLPSAWKALRLQFILAAACAFCAVILVDQFIPWEFPIFGKPIPYSTKGTGFGGKHPPYNFFASINVDLSKNDASLADIAATCAAASRYFIENYGLSAFSVEIYNSSNTGPDYPECHFLLGQCAYSPNGHNLKDKSHAIKQGWSNFRVARDYPLSTIRECSQIMAHAPEPVAERDEFLRNELGIRGWRKLKPDLMDVLYTLLPENLCERPANSGYWSRSPARALVIKECEGLFEDLKAIGAKAGFAACYVRGCADSAYNAWARRKYFLWRDRKGNFGPELAPYNAALDALAKAYAQEDQKEIASLSSTLEKILVKLNDFNPCGNK